jgi:hypothetical protein
LYRLGRPAHAESAIVCPVVIADRFILVIIVKVNVALAVLVIAQCMFVARLAGVERT